MFSSQFSTSPPFSTLNSQFTRRRPRRVLYFDFQRSEHQWVERYSAASPVPGKLPVGYRFSPRFLRAAIEFNGEIPPAFKGDINRFLQHSIAVKIADAEPDVVIIDNISYLFGGTPRASNGLRAMKTLKLWAATHGIAILVIAQMKNKRQPTPITLEDIAARGLADEADTVFALGASTFGPNYRYIKHLSSPRPITHHTTNLLTYEISRMDSGKRKVENAGTRAPLPAPAGNAGALACSSTANRQNCPLPTPSSASPTSAPQPNPTTSATINAKPKSATANTTAISAAALLRRF
ncbi:MAG: AAA family ATPase [Pyrinomonadaceae bacterium]